MVSMSGHLTQGRQTLEAETVELNARMHLCQELGYGNYDLNALYNDAVDVPTLLGKLLREKWPV